jgi:hypothetical protein
MDREGHARAEVRFCCSGNLQAQWIECPRADRIFIPFPFPFFSRKLSHGTPRVASGGPQLVSTVHRPFKLPFGCKIHTHTNLIAARWREKALDDMKDCFWTK